MTDVNQLITQHLDIWSSAIEKKSNAGRGNGGGIDLYGIKRLRELILELAVRGKLVPQINGEGHADGLLDQVLLQQAKMYKKGQIKKPKVVPKITDTEKPFGLPQGWTWCRISQVGHDWGQKIPNDKFTYIDVGSINKELGIVSEPTVLDASEAPSRARKLVRNGTVVYSTVRPYLLNIAVISEEFEPEPIASTAFAIVHPFEGVSASFLYRYLRSPTFISYVESCQTGIAYPAINDKQFFSAVVPLPPTDEQYRIVAKVDELMKLCDALERQAEDSLKAHQTLVETCLATLTNSQSPVELTQNWTRIEAHFDVLFNTEDSAEQLRETILALAVSGRLVRQNDGDEPAVEILERICSARAKEEKSRQRSRRKLGADDEVSDSPQLKPIPKGWAQARFGDVFSIRTGYAFKSGTYSTEGTPVFRVTNFDNKGEYDLSDLKYFPNELLDEKMSRFLLEEGETIMVMVGGSIGKTTTVTSELLPALLNQNMWRIRSFGQSLLNAYELLLIRQENKNLAGMTKSTHGHFSMQDYSNRLVLIPPLEEQARIVDAVEKLTSFCDQISQKSRQIQSLSIGLADTLTFKIH